MAKKLKSPINGLYVGTFVKGYKGQGQMNTNTISGRNLTSRGNKIIRELYKVLGKR